MAKTPRFYTIRSDIYNELASQITANIVDIASPTLAGKVSISNQTFAGVKTFQDGIVLPTSLTLRNKIINGDFRINQRYGTNKRTNPSASTYEYNLDRWSTYSQTASTMSTQQVLLATTDDPLKNDGLTYYLRANKETAASSSDVFIVQQAIEGNNCQDLKWGTATAKNATLSFWARASASYTFSVAICNTTTSATMTYVVQLPVTASWQKFTFVIPGPTSGAWASDSACGISVRFVLGGSGTTSTFGSWKADNLYVGGSTQFGSLAQNSYFDVSGVQFEVGSVASQFEHRPIQTEVAMCQRYYEKSYPIDVTPGSNTNSGVFYHLAASDSSSNSGPYIQFKVTKRSSVTLAAFTNTGAAGWIYSRSGVANTTSTAIQTAYLGPSGGLVYIGVGAAWVSCSISGHWTADSEIL